MNIKEKIVEFLGYTKEEADKIAENHRRKCADEVDVAYNTKTGLYDGKAVYYDYV